MEREAATLPRCAFDGYLAAMERGDVFYDGKPESGAAEFAAARAVHAVETFEDAG